MAEHSDGSIVIDTELDTSSVKSGIADTRQKLLGLSNQFKNLGRDLNTAFGNFRPVFEAVSSDTKAFASDLSRLDKAVQAGFSSARAVLSFHSTLEKAEERTTGLAQKLDELGQKQIPTRTYQMYADELKNAQEELSKLIARQEMMSDLGVKETSAQWKRVALQIDQTRGVIIDLENDMKALRESGDAFTFGNQSEEYKALRGQLEEARSTIDRNRQLINSEKIEQAQLNVQAAQEAVIVAKTTGERTRALEKLREAQAALQSIASQSSATPQAPETSKWEKFRATISGLGKEFVKVPFRLLASGAKAAANGLKSLISRTKQTALTAKGLTKALTSLKTILISRLKRTFISAIINGVKEGINALAQYSSEFDGVMSNIKNRSKELSANLSGSVGSFISAVEPLITTILESLSKAATYLNAFIGMLQGKSTITVAKKQTDSYAKSLDNAADSAKELKAQVYSFDDLNKASSTSDSSKKKDNADLFEEKSIEDLVPSGLLEMLEKIKDALLNGEWRNAGQFIGEGLNAIIQTIDDFINGTLRPKGVEWAANIAELLNGIVDTLDFRNIGKNLANGINAIADILNTFLTTFDFVALGKGLGEGINGLFENIEWGLLGEMFANNWNALIDLIYGLVTTVKWDVVGDKLAEFVQSFADNLKIEELADAIGIGLNGIITLLQHFLDGVDWDGIATRLGDGINRIFGHIDWPAVGKLLSDGVIKALSFLNTAIETVDWYAIGADVSHALNAIDWPRIFGELARTLSDLLVGALDLLLGCVEELDWFKLGEDLWDSLVAIVENIDWNGIISKAFELLGAAVGGIGDFFGKIGTWIKENIFDPFVNGFKELFGINSPSTVMAELGGYLIDGLKKGISDAWSKITGFFTEKLPHLASTIKNKWEGMKKDASEKWGEIKEKISTSISSAKTTAEEKVNSLKTSFVQKWSGFVSDASTKWANVKKTITDTAESIRTTATQKIDTLKRDVKTKWDNLKNDLDRTKFDSTGENLVSGLQSGIENAWNGLTRTVKSLASSLTGVVQRTFEINSPSRVWAEIGEYLDRGLQEGILAEEDSVLHTVSNLARSVNRDMTINDPSIGINGATLSSVDKLTGRFDGLLDKLTAVSEMLHDIGTFTTPIMATGTVVPYAVTNALSSSRGSTGDPDVLQTALDGQGEVLSEIMYLLGQILTAVRTKDLSIDAGVLTETITRIQKKKEIDYGGF